MSMMQVNNPISNPINNMDRQISTRIDTINDERTRQYIDDSVKREVKNYLQSTAFTARKLTDTPKDANQVVPRKYVTLNGIVSNRPVSSIATIGQPYFATDTNIPMTYSLSGWRNGVGSIVALNN